MIEQRSFTVNSKGRGSYNVTNEIVKIVANAGVTTGLCHVFLQHTSASLILCENADPTVRRDLEAFMTRLVPDGDSIYQHTIEGPDDMPAHVRTTLTQNSITIPISNHQCALGTWQGVYLWEHRLHPHRRQVIVTLQGD